jgi:hypothetical protein
LKGRKKKNKEVGSMKKQEKLLQYILGGKEDTINKCSQKKRK